MAKMGEAVFLVQYSDATLVAEAKKKLTQIARETFKKYVKTRGLKSLQELESNLGYDISRGSNMAKDDLTIKYFKGELPEVPGKIVLAYLHQNKIYIFV